MKDIKDLQAGIAGEYLVCADLILQGYTAYPSEQGLHYDVVVDNQGELIRVQVKTTRKEKSIPQRKNYTPAYLFNARRYGKNGRQSYDGSEFDVMAFVVLTKRKIAYVKESEVNQTMHFRSYDFDYGGTKKGRYLEDYNNFKDAIS